eukprot:697549-Lingulodinium_polyedra.AAC.1
MNLTYGPWEGAGWFEKLRSAALEHFAHDDPSSPLWREFYALVCRDLQEQALGTMTHRRELLQEVSSGEAFGKKGDRVTLKRWFSWMSACPYHDRVWHSRLLAITSLGIQLGVYQSWEEVPLWGGPPQGKEEKPGKEGEEEGKAAGSSAAQVAEEAKTRGKAQAPKEAAGAGGKELMKQKDADVAALRQKCRNT